MKGKDYMERRRICFIICISLVCLVGCSVTHKLTMEELLVEVNAEHQMVKKEGTNGALYIGDPPSTEKIKKYFSSGTSEIYTSEKVLTKSQAEEDVVFLFDLFHNYYGPYEYFGGEKVFALAEEKIKEELQTKERLTADDFEQILLKNLTFIKDGHFQINMKNPNSTKIPFFFRDVIFFKTEKGYQTSDGRKVESVEGYDNLDELMKYSISSDGQLVYYPVLLQDGDFWESLEQPQVCEETLKVHYQNGEIDELKAEPFQMYYKPNLDALGNTQVLQFREDEEIPVLQMNAFNEDYTEEILAGTEWLQDSPIAILDLRFNEGGDGSITSEWINKYTDNIVPSNTYSQSKLEGSPFNRKDRWITNENILIILVGKFSASASERLLDYAYNVENVLIVGENTAGALISSSSVIYLPNSICQINLGDKLNTFPDKKDYFEELRGFCPDIWVPAEEAEELIVKMIKQIK